MASRMHFFTFLMALAVLFALASAAQLEDSPVSEGAVVPEVTEAPNKDLAKFSSDSLVAELLQRGVDPATNLLAMTGTSCSRKLRSKIKSLKKIESQLRDLEKLNNANFGTLNPLAASVSSIVSSTKQVSISARSSKRIIEKAKSEIDRSTRNDVDPVTRDELEREMLRRLNTMREC